MRKFDGCCPLARRRYDRRHSVLDAAEQLFLEQGFDRVSLGEIVRRSGGSLATVYEMFGNKQGLLRAVVERGREEGLQGIEEIGRDHEPPSEILRQLALRYHAFATSSRTVSLMRLVIAESLNDPEFGRAFDSDMKAKFVEPLAESLRIWTAEGKARVDDPEAAAELYFSTILCDAPLKALLGTSCPGPDPKILTWRLAPFLSHFGMI